MEETTPTPEEREQFPFKDYEVASGITTIWPPGSHRNNLAREVCEFMMSHREFGYGNMVDIAKQLLAQEEREIEDRNRRRNAMFRDVGRADSGAPADSVRVVNLAEDAPGGDSA